MGSGITKVLIAHDNWVYRHTARAHRLAKQLDKDPKIEVLYDKKMWKEGEVTTHGENVRREKEMVNRADLTIRLVHSPSKTGEPRHQGAIRETLETMHQKKPVVQIFESGARDSPKRTYLERTYQHKLNKYLKPGESLPRTALESITEVKRGFR